MYHLGQGAVLPQAKDNLSDDRGYSPLSGTDLGDLNTSADGYFSRENLLRRTDIRNTSQVEQLPVTKHHRTPERGVGTGEANLTDLFKSSGVQSQTSDPGFTPTPPKNESLPFSLLHNNSYDYDLGDAMLNDSCYFEDSASLSCRKEKQKKKGQKRNIPHTVTSNDSIDDSGISTSMTSQDQELHNASVSATVAPTDGRKLNESLTNIQWLEGMKGNNLDSDGSTIHKDFRLFTSQSQIEKISRECGRTKRPPFSYMHLIQMAICSTPDGQKTLKEIYQWIQDQFPYYRHHLNQGWKNSIRHNLSLYDIFVRKKNKQPGQTGCSYWTIRPDAECKPLRARHTTPSFSKEDPNACDDTVPPVFVVNNYDALENFNRTEPREHKTSKKAGPVPLLPKPPAIQAYALIPIQGGVPMLSQPVLVQSVSQAAQVAQQALTGDGCNRNSPIPWATPEDLVDQKPKSLKRNITPMITTEVPKMKQPKILAKPNILNRALRIKSEPTGNLISMDYGANLSYNGAIDRSDTSSYAASSSFCGDVSYYSGNNSISTDFLPNQSQGLPRPKMYNKRKCKLIPKVQKEEGVVDSLPSCNAKGNIIQQCDDTIPDQESFSDSGIQELLASVANDFPSPLRALLQTPPKSDLNKGEVYSPNNSSTPDYILVSPIHGSGSESSRRGLEKAGGFFFTPDSEERCSNSLKRTKLTPPKLTDPLAFTHLKSSTPYHSDASPKLKDSTPFKLGSPSLCFKNSSDKSPGLGSLQGLGLQGLTPLKSPQRSCSDSPESGFSNQNFTKLFGGFHLDSMLEDSINIDVADLNFDVDYL